MIQCRILIKKVPRHSDLIESQWLEDVKTGEDITELGFPAMHETLMESVRECDVQAFMGDIQMRLSQKTSRRFVEAFLSTKRARCLEWLIGRSQLMEVD